MKTSPTLHRSALTLALLWAGGVAAQTTDHAAHAAQPTAGKPAAPPAAADAKASEHSAMEHAAMDHSQMDHSQMDHATMQDPPRTQAPAASQTQDHSKMDHSQSDHSQMDHSKMGHSGMDPSGRQRATTSPPPASEPREPIPTPTDADRAAAFPPLSHHMRHAPAVNSYLLINRLEAVEVEHGSAQAWEGQGWIGTDTDRLWLRSEGEREHGRTESADLEVLYGRAISPWWDLVAGVKHDFAPAGSQTWAAIGVQGLSPYKFEVAATAYIGESGRTALNLEAEYELLLTNRLILQPLVEIELSGRDDPQRGIGSGLSSVEAGLRLRYEITRRFAPYVGVTWERAFGGTADYRRDAGESVEDTRLVAGLRLWF
ncbi:copper resistance protein B [Lysobacter antibioticus]|uniref:Copper resistance protein B n=1 Tax=Lysobacter antibioticus TaxID=84531 RepID=A0A0S2FB95_LYSAN|nr:copper resistance protein B [Lysobacter antibioticus]ALN80717.1 copper resistance protein B [Lysobacter antibioticus]